MIYIRQYLVKCYIAVVYITVWIMHDRSDVSTSSFGNAVVTQHAYECINVILNGFNLNYKSDFDGTQMNAKNCNMEYK